MIKEYQIQNAIIQWVRTLGYVKRVRIDDYLFSIPNGGYRKAFEAFNLIRSGVKSGVSDMFFAYPSNNYHGLWLEIKTPNSRSKLTKSQQEWIDRMNDIGYKAIVIRSLDEFINEIRSYIGNPLQRGYQNECK